MEAPDKDPLAPLVAAVVIGTIVALAVLFVLITGGGVSPARAWTWIVRIGPYYLGAVGMLLVLRWFERRKRR